MRMQRLKLKSVFGCLAVVFCLVGFVFVLITQAFVPELVAQDNITVPTNQPRGGTEKQPRYRLVDLGTFGGPVSIVFGGTGNLNQHKALLTSCADTSVLDSEWPNINPWSGDDPYIEHAFRTHGGPLEDLGALPGGSTSCGQGINSNGTVAGFSATAEIDPLTGYREIHATRWQDGKILDLGTLGGNESEANFINDRGQITGGALTAIPDAFTNVFFIGATQVHAFLWERGTMRDLGTLGGSDSSGFYINQRGEIAGASFTNDVPNETTGIPTVDPFLWRNGRMLDLGSLGGTSGTPNALNSQGQVVGMSNLAGDDAWHPFLWEKGTMIDLGTFGGDGFALGINDDGAIVGRAYFAGDERWDAFLWAQNVMTDLGNLGCTSTAYSINSKRQIAGTSRLADCQTVHAVLWQNGNIYDLNDLIPPGSSLELVETQQINEEGVIAGNGLPPGCDDVHICGHAFLLFPCDEQPGECKNETSVHDSILRYEPSRTVRLNTTTRRQPRGRHFAGAASDTEH